MKITVHRGGEEIGGNCIEVQSGESRILLDYGTPLPKIDPVTHKNVNIPYEAARLDIPGLYPGSPGRLDGLIISHTHQDHYGMLFGPQINQDLPVYMTGIMEAIVRITGKMGPAHAGFTANVKHFHREQPFTVGAFKITPYLMDHSASESFGFLIEAEGKKIIYTGDYREHGHRVHAFQRFLEAQMGHIDLVLTEGTQAGVETGPDERSVMNEIEGLLKQKGGTLYVMCAGQNIDLLTSLAGIAAKNGRYLAVDGYVALVLDTLKSLAAKQGITLKIPGLDSEYFKVLDTKTMINLRRYYPAQAEKIEKKVVTWDWATENLSRLIIPVRSYAQYWVEEHVSNFDNALFVYSFWEGYKEEIEYQKTLDWFKTRGMPAHSAHVSGHAYFSSIRKLLDSKNPRHIIPVHTEHPEKFTEAYGDRVHVLRNGGSFEL
jgi:ribonuclease J